MGLLIFEGQPSITEKASRSFWPEMISMKECY